MTKYDFDHVIDRHGTFSTQWDYIADRFGRNDILPFSISDTDFPVPAEVQEALEARFAHPIYGYTRWNHEAYKNSIVHWFEKDGHTKIDPDWIVYSPSVVFTIATLIRMNSQPGDAVAVFTPMYDAFYGTIEKNDRMLVPVRLRAADEGYQIDWDSLETVLAEEQTKIFLLTNPHNPTGRIFSKAELRRLYELCQSNHVFLISDDIHRDMVYLPHVYEPITNIGLKDVALCCSGSKTFNTPGLIGSYVFLPDPDLRTQFLIELKQKNALSSVSIFGMLAQIAAYNGSADYVEQLVAYTKKNLETVAAYLHENMPELKFSLPDATYLAWINVSGLGLSSDALQHRLVDIGHVGIMSGKTYGDARYLRMNIACPQEKLLDGLARLKKGIKG
ncbi:pyridoxal phosphate-dependent aminotransferase [Lacticaseibacillus casei]|uniref:cysteine-S-conjugate beta-lyase n=1 Tax=Lacticaseibacillus huelsenbergensis TaxID=3035291 RepID=A0ABY8DP41_9LACO|nr:MULTISPECIES: MalY/PatB family protein [Lacticaseibacillus]MDG3061252.1 pyridoxal phosphate-dependent aminotransferase [Lacticaseibacillus sp. BCRC 81376]QVI38719.1 pyridoxal phosphate-dependent aminotransferase [Lacticaseibacillus casei]QXG60446.1 pyridoxal phosphate-dependent aminotransferase [Lacticaseibacillus casei]WFB37998.1 pyridoxal phosphate-dependent aminotransferase [Lacticaseibacillus huelsenbergensis]WFB42402.1 pyridoxal phosphate-dependent aminotransferase [Lacticaseibacillus 